jgi:molybdate transport system substrate-binding protein
VSQPAAWLHCVLVASLLGLPACAEKRKRLLFHAGVGQRSSLTEVEQLFRQRHPEVEVNFSFKGSGYFIADLARSGEGDLYLPGEEFYLLQAVERGFICSSSVSA